MIKILIVDDDPIILKFCEVLLHSLGRPCEVTLSLDPLDAVKKLSHISFDLIITDIMMPKVNGNTFLRAARELSFQTPILMISGKRDDKTVHNVFALGATDFLSKPLQRESFIEKIQQWLPPPSLKP